ncbi:MAG TPA: type I phosphomannose isomerase catalytic subunit, partial [Ktedonobacterales bacterium]
MAEYRTSGETMGPIMLRSSLHETIWGGRHLATQAGKQLPDGKLIGESWETALDSIARNAPYAGQALGDLTSQFGEELIGWRAVQVFGKRFPLLTKFLDAQQPLSVQVHPNDEYAAKHEGGKLGKTEVWYILHAAPGAQLVYGLRRETTREEVRTAIEETRLEDLLNTFEAHEGDVILVPAGTVHAICDGIVLYELQEYSDVTYRLYDYGRLQSNGKPRELHVERGLDVMRYSPPPVERVQPVMLSVEHIDGTCTALAACRYFVEEEWRFNGDVPGSTHSSSCQIITLLSDTCTLRTPHTEVQLALGDTVV